MGGCCGPALPQINGLTAGGASSSQVGPDSLVTTDASVQTLVMANFPVVGARVYYYGEFAAEQNNSNRGFRFNFWVDASRNAIGSNVLTTGTIGPTGFTDIATAPWNTIGVPAGWAFNPTNLVGNQLQIQFNAAAAQTVQWMWQLTRFLLWGATP